MSYSVKTIIVFEKQVKRLVKKYPSLKTELVSLIATLKDNPSHGTALGKDCLKSEYQLLRKEKENREGQEILLTLL